MPVVSEGSDWKTVLPWLFEADSRGSAEIPAGPTSSFVTVKPVFELAAPESRDDSSQPATSDNTNKRAGRLLGERNGLIAIFSRLLTGMSHLLLKLIVVSLKDKRVQYSFEELKRPSVCFV